MSNEDIDYVALYRNAIGKREEIRRELSDLDGLIYYLEPLAVRAGLPPDEVAPVRGVAPPDHVTAERLPPVESTGNTANLPYHRLPSTDAALDYLKTVGEPRTTRQVADALRAGGFESASPNYRVNIYTSLKRLRDRGVIKQVGAGLWQAK